MTALSQPPPDHEEPAVLEYTAGDFKPLESASPTPDEFQSEAPTIAAALRMFDPDGDLQIVSIYAAEERPVRTFMVRGDFDAAAAWIQRENGEGRNIYWQPNRVRPDLNGKAGKPDIIGARFFQVDIDPEAGAALDTAAVTERLNRLPVPPSFIIFSGGGVQALWRLSEAHDA